MLNVKKFISYLDKNTQATNRLKQVIIDMLDYAEEFRFTLIETKNLLKRFFEGICGLTSADIDTLEMVV